MRINFDLKQEVADDLRRKADAQGRSVSDIMRQLIVEFIERDTTRSDKKETKNGH